MNCSRCGVPNDSKARFCHSCGGALGTTLLQGRTVVASPPPSAPALDVRTILQRAEQTFGRDRIAVTRALPAGAPNQRELTVFVVDTSGSMDERYDAHMKKLAAAVQANTIMIVNKARIDPLDEVGLVAFDSDATLVAPLAALSTHKPRLIQALQSLTAGGGTDINAGLMVARDAFDWGRSEVVRRIVLLTDGHGGHPIRTATDLKAQKVVIDVVGIGEDPDDVAEELLRKVASVVNGQSCYRFIKDQRTLVQHYTQLAQKTCLGA